MGNDGSEIAWPADGGRVELTVRAAARQEGRATIPVELVVNGLPTGRHDLPCDGQARVRLPTDGTRRLIQHSLQRMGVSRIDLVFVHDLSPRHFGDAWS